MLSKSKRLLALVGIVPSMMLFGAPAAFADSIDTTGPDSTNFVNNTDNSVYTATNNNTVNVSNSNYQTASSGDATVYGNTNGGSATSGSASNYSSTETNLSINNMTSLPSGSGGMGGNTSIYNTGPDSYNKVYNTDNSVYTVTNNNSVWVNNSNYQAAYTGDAKVAHNTNGGSATSGNASNYNHASTSVNINNGTQSGNGNGGGSGGGQQNGSTSSSTGGGLGGQVLSAAYSSVSGVAGGFGAAFSQLPDTGARNGFNPWLITSLLTLVATVVYWAKAVSPKLFDN